MARGIDIDVLLFGAGGLVGSHVREAFADRAMLATFHRTPAPDAVRLDITDREVTRRLIERARPRVVVLAAAEPWVERCEREPEATRLVNVEAARWIADAARAIDATLVVFSSEYVFDGRAGPYREDDHVRPINEYGRQKVALEEIARTVPRHLVCRTSGVFGWEAAGKNFVCQLLRYLRAGQEFVVPSDQVITPTYAPDLASAVKELVDRGLAGTYHVVGPRTLPRLEVARLAARAFGLSEALLVPRTSAEIGYAAPRPEKGGLRDDKLRVALGRPLRDPAAALAHMGATEGRDSS